MSFLSRLNPFARKANNSLELFREVFGGAPVKSGQPVNWTTALQCATALACCRVLAEGVAQLPVRVYRGDGAARQAVSDHPVALLLARGPNDWQTTFEFVEGLMFNAVLGGGGYALKVTAPNGRLVELLPVPSTWVTVKRRADWTVYYEVLLSPSTDGPAERIEVPRERMFHVRGPSLDGYRGLEGIKYAREAIGLSLATEEAHARLHANGIQPSGILSVDGTLTEPQQRALRAYLERTMLGEGRSRALVLDRAARWTSQQMTGVDAEHLATRRHQIEEVCRALRVLPIMVGHADKTATYASAEQMFLAHVVHSLLPWVRRWEQRIARDLFTEDEVAAGYYAKFSVQGLLRGDAATRGEFYQKAVQSGWMTRNEVRGLEELDPLDGLDAPLTPANMMVGATPPDEAATGA